MTIVDMRSKALEEESLARLDTITTAYNNSQYQLQALSDSQEELKKSGLAVKNGEIFSEVCGGCS